MRPFIIFFAGAVALVGVGAGFVIINSVPAAPDMVTLPKARPAVPAPKADLARLEQSVQALSRQVEETRLTAELPPDTTVQAEIDHFPTSDSDEVLRQLERIEARLHTLEQAIARIDSAREVTDPAEAAARREEGFQAEDGYVAADALFEQGKFAIAGEGYLTFQRNWPEHPDGNSILHRARTAFQRAGYQDKALWVARQALELYPDDRRENLERLAEMEKEAKDYDQAIEHMAEVADLTSDGQERLWKRMYWAWYNQLRDGDQAGLDAYREVQRDVADNGFGEQKLGERVAEKIAEIEQRLGAR